MKCNWQSNWRRRDARSGSITDGDVMWHKGQGQKLFTTIDPISSTMKGYYCRKLFLGTRHPSVFPPSGVSVHAQRHNEVAPCPNSVTERWYYSSYQVCRYLPGLPTKAGFDTGTFYRGECHTHSHAHESGTKIHFCPVPVTTVLYRPNLCEEGGAAAGLKSSGLSDFSDLK